MGAPEDEVPVVGNGITADSLSFRLNRLGHLYQRPFRAQIGARVGLSVHEWRSIVVMATYGSVTSVEIARATGLLPMSVSRAVARLRSLELVEGTPDPSDLRATLLTLTAEGRRVYNDVAPTVKRQTDVIYQDLSDEDLERMSRYVDLLTARALDLFDAEPASSHAERESD